MMNNVRVINNIVPRRFVKNVMLTRTTAPIDQSVAVTISVTAVVALNTTEAKISHRLGVLVVREDED